MQQVGICDLQTTSLHFNTRKESIERDIYELEALIRLVIRTRDDKAAKPLLLGKLAQKRALTKSLDRLDAAQDDITTMIVKISDLTSNALAFEQLQKSKQLLRSLNQIDIETVRTVKQEVADEIAKTDAVSQILGEGPAHDPSIDDEYDQLLAKETARQRLESDSKADETNIIAAKINELSLSSVPDNEPKAGPFDEKSFRDVSAENEEVVGGKIIIEEAV